MRWAVFDVDGTLLPGTSMERLAVRRLVQSGVVTGSMLIRFLLSGLRDLALGGIPGLLRNKGYFRGIREEELSVFSERMVRRSVVPRIPSAAREEMEGLRREGFRVLLVSGAPDFMLHPLALAIGADAAIGTVLETEDGRFTGKVSGEHLYGPEKTAILKEKAAELELDFEKSVVYANDSTDAEHMRLFGTAVAVNPRPGLRREAGRKGWRVVRWNNVVAAP
ncbi:MAG: HAD-IB family hydrolase [bacterium]|nr:HAD-IB family hydrolase [bacterium]